MLTEYICKYNGIDIHEQKTSFSSFVPYHIDYLSNNLLCMYIQVLLDDFSVLYANSSIFVMHVRSFYALDIISRTNEVYFEDCYSSN